MIVRLIGGNSYNEGRVEVYYNGRWGTVCYDGLNDTFASLVCAQMKLGSSGEFAYFGTGTENILLEGVLCSPNTTVLASCGHYGVGITVLCNRYRVVGVKCNIALLMCISHLFFISLKVFNQQSKKLLLLVI